MLPVSIEPIEPIIARDGRPFDGGFNRRMRSMNWIAPSVLAGSIRTMIGKTLASGNSWFDAETVQLLRKIEVSGPFPMGMGELAGQMMLPRPQDLLVTGVDSQRRLYPLRPRRLRAGWGCDLPHAALLPVFASTAEKPVNLAKFWTVDQVLKWAVSDWNSDSLSFDEWGSLWGRGLEPSLGENRMHVQIDDKTGAAADKVLFITTGLDLRDRTLAVRIDGDTGVLQQLLGDRGRLHPLGGKRRLARFRCAAKNHWLTPLEYGPGLSGAKALRMLVMSPSLFSGGWLPGWLDSTTLEGSPPSAPELVLRLRAACVPRWEPISGWDLQAKGEKAIRRMVPAGSVYFFEVVHGEAGTLADKLWLQSVSDDDQDRRDGFGLAIFGVWNADSVDG